MEEAPLKTPEPPMLQPAPNIRTKTSGNGHRLSPKNSLKFILLLIIAVLAAIGIYLWQHAKVQNENNQLVNLQQELNTLRKEQAEAQATLNNGSSSSNPYAGWKSYTLTNERLSFNYPSNWVLTNIDELQGTDPGSDSVTIKSPAGVEIDIVTENDEHPSYDGPRTLIYSQPTTYLGQKAYIDYFADGTSSSDPISGGTVAYSSSDYPASGSGNPLSSPDYLKTKNMNPQGWLLIQVDPPSNSSVYKSTILSNQDYTDVKLIVQSMHY